MNSFGKAALIAGVLIAEGSVALAQSGASERTGQAERLICRRMPETGSIVRTRRQCFTRAQWDRIAESARTGAQKTIYGPVRKPRQQLSGATEPSSFAPVPVPAHDVGTGQSRRRSIAQGMQALGQGDFARAADFFTRAAAADPGAPPLWINLATAQRGAGDVEGERASLIRVLGLDQRHLMANIRLAELHERLGETGPATQRWSAVAAIGQLIPEDSGQSRFGLRSCQRLRRRAGRPLRRARRSGARRGARRASMQRRAGVSTRRSMRCSAAGASSTMNARACTSPSCRPTSFSIAAISPGWPRSRRGRTRSGRSSRRWCRRASRASCLMSRWNPACRRTNGAASIIRSIGRASSSGASASGSTRPARAARRPRRHSKRCRSPTCRSARPPRSFRCCKPGVRLPAHTGVSNARAIVHLPLIIPPGCALRVGGETREWKRRRGFRLRRHDRA